MMAKNPEISSSARVTLSSCAGRWMKTGTMERWAESMDSSPPTLSRSSNLSHSRPLNARPCMTLSWKTRRLTRTACRFQRCWKSTHNTDFNLHLYSLLIQTHLLPITSWKTNCNTLNALGVINQQWTFFATFFRSTPWSINLHGKRGIISFLYVSLKMKIIQVWKDMGVNTFGVSYQHCFNVGENGKTFSSACNLSVDPPPPSHLCFGKIFIKKTNAWLSLMPSSCMIFINFLTTCREGFWLNNKEPVFFSVCLRMIFLLWFVVWMRTGRKACWEIRLASSPYRM